MRGNTKRISGWREARAALRAPLTAGIVLGLACAPACTDECAPGFTLHEDVCVRSVAGGGGPDSGAGNGGHSGGAHGGETGGATAGGSGGARSAMSASDSGPDVSIPPSKDATDATDATGATGAIDARPRHCSADAPFLHFTSLPGPVNDTAPGWSSHGAALSGDGLTLYFVRSTDWIDSTPPIYELYTAHRASSADVFDDVQRMRINAPGVNTSPSVTPDELNLLFVSDRESPFPSVFISTRARRSDEFVTATPLQLDTGPRIVAGGTFFATDASSAYVSLMTPEDPNSADLYEVVGQLGTTAPALHPLDTVNSEDDEFFPVASADGLVLYFARLPHVNADGGPPGLKYSMFVATRPSRGVPFGNVAPALTTANTDVPSYVTPDLCTLYYSTDYADRQQIWVATR